MLLFLLFWADVVAVGLEGAVTAEAAVAADADMTPLHAVNVLDVILARRSFSNPPTVKSSSETNDSTEKASSPMTVGTAVILERTEGSRSPSTLVRSLKT